MADDDDDDMANRGCWTKIVNDHAKISQDIHDGGSTVVVPRVVVMAGEFSHQCVKRKK